MLIFFWKDIVVLAKAWFRGLFDAKLRSDPDYRLAWLVIIGSLPIVVVGFLGRDLIAGPLRSLWVVAFALIIWGGVMLLAEAVAKQNRGDRDLNLMDALLIGFAQCLALVPGVSRSGATISVGLMRGLDRVTATRLAFLLGIPALVGAGVYELPAALKEGGVGCAAHPGRHRGVVRGGLRVDRLAAQVRRRAHHRDLRLVPVGAGRGHHHRAEHRRAGGDLMTHPEPPADSERRRSPNTAAPARRSPTIPCRTPRPTTAGRPKIATADRHGRAGPARPVDRQHRRHPGRPHARGCSLDELRRGSGRRDQRPARRHPVRPADLLPAGALHRRRWHPFSASSGLQIEIDDRFVEVDYGDWSGRQLKDLGSEPLWRTVQRTPPPPSSRAAKGWPRCPRGPPPGSGTSALRRDAADQTVLVCSHGDVIKAILADALGMHLDAFQRIVVAPASISVIRYTPLRPFVERVNDTGDLGSISPYPTATSPPTPRRPISGSPDHRRRLRRPRTPCPAG